MLFTDSDLVTAQDLTNVSSEVADVVKQMKGTVLEGPNSIIRTAWEECASNLNEALQVYSTYWGTMGGGGSGLAGHMAALGYGGMAGVGNMPRIMLNQVVAHNWRYANALSPIQQWVRFVALFILYDNASNRLNVDRYEEKRNNYKAQAANAWELLKRQGLPCVLSCLDAPGSLHAFNAGSWTVGTTAASGALGGQFYVAITYTDSSVYQSITAKGNGESGPSCLKGSAFGVPLAVGADSAITIDISALNPPNGQAPAFGIADGILSTMNATGWNIYVGAVDPQWTPPTMYYQASLPIETKTYAFTSDPVLSGQVLQQGQYPFKNLEFGQNLIDRG